MASGNRFELLRPRQIEAIRATCPVAMFPFGSLEHHGRHLPVGLDAIKAHELLLRLSARVGGVVLPPLFWGTGGGHLGYDWTIMAKPAQLRPLMTQAFCRMYECGFPAQVAITGHYPPEQRDMVQQAADTARRRCKHLQLWAGPEYDAVPHRSPAPADHAGKWETSLLQALRPDLVAMLELNFDGLDRPLNWPQYQDEQQGFHEMQDDAVDPLYGIWGHDPRVFASPAVGDELVAAIVSALEAWVRQALAAVQASRAAG